VLTSTAHALDQSRCSPVVTPKDDHPLGDLRNTPNITSGGPPQLYGGLPHRSRQKNTPESGALYKGPQHKKSSGLESVRHPEIRENPEEKIPPKMSRENFRILWALYTP